MTVRTAMLSDIDSILCIYEEARGYMRRTGNALQWSGGYPDRATVERDIEEKRLFVLTDEDSLIGVFCFFIGEEQTYAKIYDGEWGSTDPCGVIHRVAVSDAARGRGVSRSIFDFCAQRSNYIRIDTHRDNVPMQKALLKFGFVRRGIIYLANGDERIAFDYYGKRDT